MFYEGSTPQKELNIDKIRFICSFGYDADFISEERSGAFWELFYTEKGQINISTDSQIHTLSKSCLFFRKPGETLTLSAYGSAPAGTVSIGFDCSSVCMNYLPNSPLSIGPIEQRLVSHLVHEADTENTAAFASGQLILLYLQLLLIQLIRNNRTGLTTATVISSQRWQQEDEFFQSIIIYMENHIREHLTIDRICHDNLIGRGSLQKIFSTNAGCGVIDYFSLMKINTAKQLIRENQMNFSQIAEYLGYNSIHYFSRQFKRLTGITPTDYAASIRPS